MEVLLTVTPRFELHNDIRYIDVESCKKGSRPSLALYQLASMIREEHGVHVLDPAVSDFQPFELDLMGLGGRDVLEGLRFPALEKSINSIDIVGISATSFEWFLAKIMAERIKEIDPDLPIIAGGVHATIADEYILESSRVDYVVRGEGEKALPELLRFLQDDRIPKSVEGVSYRRDGTIVRNKDRSPMAAKEMEELPLPAFDLMPSNLFGKLTLETSRGCRFNCSFCSLLFRGLWRGLGPEAVLKRVEHAVSFASKLYGDQKAIHFIDATFVADAKRAETIFKGLKEMDLGDLRIAFEGRINEMSNPDILKHCKDIPIDYIVIGIESGYDRGLRMIRKGITTRSIERFGSMARSLSSYFRYGFIIGFPWETKEDCLNTLAFADRMVSKYGGLAVVGWYQLYPGSTIWNDRMQYGINEGWELFDSLHLRSQAFRFKISPKLTEDDILEIDKQIDKYNLIRIVNSSDRSEDNDAASPIYTPTDGYFLSKMGGLIDKTQPYFDGQTKLFCLDRA
jgi:anaerobic magnesium-protoporphyrin IX monomethyl ester cyclase